MFELPVINSKILVLAFGRLFCVTNIRFLNVFVFTVLDSINYSQSSYLD